MSTVLAVPVPAVPGLDSTVHIVDPDARCRGALAGLLLGAGHEVETYPSAEAFLAGARRGRGCVLLDARKVGPEGLSLQRVLAEHGSTLPVVVLAACHDVPLSVQAMKNGADDVLAEPVTTEQLLAAITQALAHDARLAAARLRSADLRARYASMTTPERHVFVRVAGGMLNKQIAFDLSRSERTVKAHRSRAMTKMGASSVADIVRMVDQLGVSEVNP